MNTKTPARITHAGLFFVGKLAHKNPNADTIKTTVRMTIQRSINVTF